MSRWRGTWVAPIAVPPRALVFTLKSLMACVYES